MAKHKAVSYKYDMAFPDPRSEGVQMGMSKLEYISTAIYSKLISAPHDNKQNLDSLAVYAVMAGKALLTELNKQP